MCVCMRMCVSLTFMKKLDKSDKKKTAVDVCAHVFINLNINLGKFVK